MSDRGNALLRHFDRYIGIPLIFILGLFKGRKKKNENFKKVGFLATAAIGDTLLISPVLKDFRAKYPDSEIIVFSGKTNRSTFDMTLPDFNIKTIPVGNPIKAIREIRKFDFDLFFDFGPWPRINSLITNFVKSQFKVGFKSINQFRHYIYNYVVEHRDDCHEIDNLRRLVKDFGVESKSVPYLGINKPDFDKNYIVVHMFPSGYKAYYKEWSDKNWIKLINGLTSKGFNVFLTGAPKDVEACNRIYNSCSNPEKINVLAGKTTLLEVGDVLRDAIKVISVNTGIMHMAAAYNAEVIALHGPTSPLRWGPVCENKKDFCAKTKGAGKLHLGFEYVRDDINSLDSIDPIKVLEAAISEE